MQLDRTTLKTFHVWCNHKSQRKSGSLANLFGDLKGWDFSEYTDFFSENDYR